MNKIQTVIIAALLFTTGIITFLWYQQSQDLDKYEQVASHTRDLANTVNSIYDQFVQVDQNAHGLALEACLQIEISNSGAYQELVDNGTCDPFSDVFKPDYSRFTPALTDSANSINSLFGELGIEQIPNFEDKPTENYNQVSIPSYPE